MFYGEFLLRLENTRDLAHPNTPHSHTPVFSTGFFLTVHAVSNTGGIGVLRQRMVVLASMAEATPSLHCHNNSHFEYEDVVL